MQRRADHFDKRIFCICRLAGATCVCLLCCRRRKERGRKEIKRRCSHPAQVGRNRQSLSVQKREYWKVMNQREAIHRAENVWSVQSQGRRGIERFLRRHRKVKTDKADSDKEHTLRHEAIHGQKSRSVNEILFKSSKPM